MSPVEAELPRELLPEEEDGTAGVADVETGGGGGTAPVAEVPVFAEGLSAISLGVEEATGALLPVVS